MEPVKQNFDILLKNIHRNGYKQILALNVGAWKEQATMYIARERQQHASLIEDVVEPRERVLVRVDTIDHVLQQEGIAKVDFIRMQINGAEVEALQGMWNTLLMRPKLLISSKYRMELDFQKYLGAILQRFDYQIHRYGNEYFAAPRVRTSAKREAAEEPG